MTGPIESPFASIRELTAAERRITDAMTAMKNELLDAIDRESKRHDVTHEAMRLLGENRHRRIDDFIGADALDDARRTGMMSAATWTVRAFRFVNEFRWVFVGAALFLGFLLGGFQFTVVMPT